MKFHNQNKAFYKTTGNFILPYFQPTHTFENLPFTKCSGDQYDQICLVTVRIRKPNRFDHRAVSSRHNSLEKVS